MALNLFENVIDEKVIDSLDKDTLEKLLKMFDKAGY
jgi:hypothetical protein